MSHREIDRLAPEAGAEAEVPNSDPIVPANLNALLDAACEAVAIDCDLRRKRFRDALGAASSFYDKESAAVILGPKTLRAQFRKLREAIDALTDDIAGVPRQVALALDGLVPPSFEPIDRDQTMLEQLSDMLMDAAEALDVFDMEYAPPQGRRANIALQSALLIIREAFLEATGEELRARFDKPSGNAPAFTTAAGRTVRDFLIGLDPALNEVMIANMLEKLRSKGPSSSHEDALEAPRMIRALDASLLSGRQTAIRSLIRTR